MSCTDIAKYFPHFQSAGEQFLLFSGPQLTGFGDAPQQAFWQAFLPLHGAIISSVFTLELLAQNTSVATLALLAD